MADATRSLRRRGTPGAIDDRDRGFGTVSAVPHGFGALIGNRLMEGTVFSCSWKREGNGYRVWVKQRPKLAAKGRTFHQADRRLWSVIITATGDGESIREYHPPPPQSDSEIEVQAAPMDSAPWMAAVSGHKRRRPKPEPLNTNAKIQRRFAVRVNEHFAFLRELGFKGPRFSSDYDRLTGMSWRARFGSASRTLDIGLSKAHREYASSTDFEINPKPVVDRWEAFLSTMYLGLRYRPLLDQLAEIERTHTLDEIMDLAFPIYVDLFRGELLPVLTGEQWHDEYTLYRDA